MPKIFPALPFFEAAERTIRSCPECSPTGAQYGAAGGGVPDKFLHLTGESKAMVDAVRSAPFDPAVCHRAMQMLRNQGKLAEVDLLYTLAPVAVRFDHAVMSVWCSIPRILQDSVEQLRRAEKMKFVFPNDPKSLNHMIFALYATVGFDSAMKNVERWMAEYPDNLDILGPAANIAFWAERYAVAEDIYRHLAEVQRGGLEAGSYRMLIIALRRQCKNDVADRTLAEALSKYPGSNLLIDL